MTLSYNVLSEMTQSYLIIKLSAKVTTKLSSLALSSLHWIKWSAYYFFGEATLVQSLHLLCFFLLISSVKLFYFDFFKNEISNLFYFEYKNMKKRYVVYFMFFSYFLSSFILLLSSLNLFYFELFLKHDICKFVLFWI